MTREEALKALAAQSADDMTREEESLWHDYCRWAIGPLGTREQWLRMHRLALSNWPAWRKLNGV
jgi:hypothetical protein